MLSLMQAYIYDIKIKKCAQKTFFLHCSSDERFHETQ